MPEGKGDGPGDRAWCVMRQDDNGNRYVVAEGLTEAEARERSAAYAARGHKQMYWVEPMERAPVAPGSGR